MRATSRTVRDGVLCAAGDGPAPGVLLLGGSEGGLHERDARVPAGAGFTVLALAYFAAPGVRAGGRRPAGAPPAPGGAPRPRRGRARHRRAAGPALTDALAPGPGVTFELGGTPAVTTAARATAWSATVDFLTAHLRTDAA